MMWILLVLILNLWVIGVATGVTISGFAHILIVLTFIGVIIRMVFSRRTI